MKRCAFLAILLAACGSVTEETRTLARIDDNHYLGAAVTAENLTVWPVYADVAPGIGEFLTLEEAQARELAEIREMGGPAAPQAGRTVQQGSRAGQQEGQQVLDSNEVFRRCIDRGQV